MKLKSACTLWLGVFMLNGQLGAHCQMPCGIYHDDVVFDQIDQYIETMYKGVSVMNNSKFDDAKLRNEFVRWVMEKDRASDEVAEWITRYFLQQKIKPGEADTPKKLAAAHLLLFNLVAVKQNSALECIEDFSKEWDKFKLMFHREGYECMVEQAKLKKIADEKAHEEQHAAEENAK